MNATQQWLRNSDAARHDGRYTDGYYSSAEYGPAYGVSRRFEDEAERNAYAQHLQELMAQRHAPVPPPWVYARSGAVVGGYVIPTRYSELAFERPIGRGPRNYRRPDERILEEVCERIARCGILADDIEVSVNAGEVTLTGNVEDRRDKRMIEELSDSVFGVRDVHNQVRVRESDGRLTGGPVRSSNGARG
ncbi:MAG: BON domain-containing protein [Myxococcaceae bacterium]